MCIVACARTKKDEWEGSGCKFSLLQKLFFQCCMHNIFLGGIFTKGASRPRMISFNLCGHGYCRGSQGMTPWMVNAVNFSEGRINRKTKPHLQTFPNEVKTQSCGLRRQQTLGAGSLTRMDPHPPVHVYMLPLEPKKIAAFVQKKKKKSKMDHLGSNQLKETGDTCCQAAQRDCLSPSEDSGSVGTCVESTHALILHSMWLHTEKKVDNQSHVRITAN